MEIVFEAPYYLLLFLLLPVLYGYWLTLRKRSSIRFSSLELVTGAKPDHNVRAVHIPLVMRMVVLLCIIIALARPQIHEAEQEIATEGIDIILALDISGSMQAEDFQPANRLEVAKEEAKKFIRGRLTDRIGLVIFAQSSITQCPLTLDHDVLLTLMDQVQIGLMKDGTAIGLAIANAINRLRDSQAKSKVIILLTDGENNAGQIDPISAAELAQTFGIKIYTIGVGKGGKVPYPVDDPLFGRRYTNVEVKIDEVTLKRIAAMTEGLYFRARDQKSLAKIYKKIDALEKSEIKITKYHSFVELYQYVAYPGLIVLLFEFVISHIVFIKIP